MSGKVVCICCDEKVDAHEAVPVEDGFLCTPCYEYDLSEPIGWVTYFDGESECKGFFGEYTVWAEDSDVEEVLEKLRKAVKWVGFGWRGYYDLDDEVLKREGYVRLHSDCILAGSADAEDLREFNERITDFLAALGVPYIVVNLRTSNVFSMGYELLITKEDAEDLEKFNKILYKLAELKYHYRDPVRFALTALTGKDEFDEKDYMLLRAWELIKQGKELDEIIKEVVDHVEPEVATA